MDQQTQHRYLSGKHAKEILGVSDNTLRRWANTGKIEFYRNSPNGKRFYDIYSVVNESNIANQKLILSNATKILSKNDSNIDLASYDKKISKTELLIKQYNIIEKPLNKISTTMDDSTINYSNIDFSMYTKKSEDTDNTIYCYCKVNKKTQQDYLDKQIKKLKQLYINSEIISCVATSDSNWKKNNILKLINNMKDNKIKELIINRSDFISDKLIELISDLCLIYNIKVIKI